MRIVPVSCSFSLFRVNLFNIAKHQQKLLQYVRLSRGSNVDTKPQTRIHIGARIRHLRPELWAPTPFPSSKMFSGEWPKAVRHVELLQQPRQLAAASHDQRPGSVQNPESGSDLGTVFGFALLGFKWPLFEARCLF